MAALTALRDAAHPAVVHDTALRSASLTAEWISLADCKERLTLPLDDDTYDVQLSKALHEALGTLENLTGRTFSDRSRVAEYAGPTATGWSTKVLAVGVPDATVTSVTRIASDATETLIASTDYDVVYQNDRPVIRLKPATDEIVCHDETWAKVEFTTALSKNSPDAQVARGLVHALIEYAHAGAQLGMDPRNSAAFKRSVRSLMDTSGSKRAWR